MVIKQTLFGLELEEAVQVKVPNPRVLYEDRENSDSYFYLNEKIMSRHIMLLGGAGCGKTNVFNLTLEQLRDGEFDDSKDVFIVFDTKGDFQRKFGREDDIILGNSKEYRSRSARWNIFEDIMADSPKEMKETNPEDYRINYELNAQEMASSLFHGRGSSSQPFFVNAAKDILAHVMIAFIRYAEKEPEVYGKFLNNEKLVSFLISAKIKDYHNLFQPFRDMTGLKSYLGDAEDGRESGQAMGVLSELKGMIYECFLGVFAAKAQDGVGFSMRKAVRQKGGRAIFVEYDLAVGESMTPIYRLMIDLALKEALGRSEEEGGNVYMILDELKLLPKLQHLDDALNFGRSLGVKVMAGLQTINQLYDIYGREKGLVIAGGFGTLFAFHTADNASREYVTELFGENVISYQYLGQDNMMEKREREGHTVEISDQMKLPQGKAIVGLADKAEPFLFQFPAAK